MKSPQSQSQNNAPTSAGNFGSNPPAVSQVVIPATLPAPHLPATPPVAPSVLAIPTHGDISQRAHDLYVESGHQQGRCAENWHRAVQDLHDRGPVACQAEHRRKDVFAPDAILEK